MSDHISASLSGRLRLLLSRLALAGNLDNLANADAAVSDIPSLNGYQEFTSSGTFTVPNGVSLVYVTMIGGGAGGGSGGIGNGAIANKVASGGGGGSPGNLLIRVPVMVVPGAEIAVSIGAAGSGGGAVTGDSTYHDGNYGGNGGNSSFGALVARGGLRGWGGYGWCIGGTASDIKVPGANGGGDDLVYGIGGANTSGSNPPANGQAGIYAMALYSHVAGGGGTGGAQASGTAAASAAGGSLVVAGYGGAAGSGVSSGGSTYAATGGGGGGGGYLGSGGAGSNAAAPNNSSSAGSDGAGYGSGGGGSGGVIGTGSSGKGGDGKPGYCLVEWNV